MQRVMMVRIAMLYLPLAAAILAALLRPRRLRMFAGCLLSLLWAMPTLLVLQRINLTEHWWSFQVVGPSLLGMPLECYLGWAIGWGLVPQLTFRVLNVPTVLVLMGAVDLWMMPMASPLLQLQERWLMGELVAIGLVLLPAVCLARWTMEETHLELRACLQVVTSGMLFLFLLPEVVFALRPTVGLRSVWQPLLEMPPVCRQIAVQLILLLAVPGVSAVAEFVQRGFGTPIPYDPPQRLVTSGVYRYCANPMQFSCMVVMLLWAALLRSPWLAVAAAVAGIYSAGIAHWDEERDLAGRFGEAWRSYRRSVPEWRLRWRPYHQGADAKLSIALTCGPCSEIRRWIEQRHPIGLTLIDAESLPAGSIHRLRYDPADGTAAVHGVVAFARALEHLHVGWAYCGMTLRLPVVHQALQLLMDASGFGPRTIPGSCAAKEFTETGVQ